MFRSGGSQVRMAAIYTENHLADLGALCVDDGSREILNLLLRFGAVKHVVLVSELEQRLGHLDRVLVVRDHLLHDCAAHPEHRRQLCAADGGRDRGGQLRRLGAGAQVCTGLADAFTCRGVYSDTSA